MISVGKFSSFEKKRKDACSHGNNVWVQLSSSEIAQSSSGGLNSLLALRGALL